MANPYTHLNKYCFALFEPNKIGNRNGGVQLVGTGCILRIGEYEIIITASHVLTKMSSTHLLFPVDSNSMASAAGRRIRFHPDQDEYDLGILILEGTVPDKQFRRLSISDLVFGSIVPGSMLVASGFPASLNKTRPVAVRFSATLRHIEFPALDFEQYATHGLTPEHHILMEHDLKKRPNKSGVPVLNGMSGSPLWIKDGVKHKVCGVLQHHDVKAKVVFGTSIALGLGAIASTLPDLQPQIPVPPIPNEYIRDRFE